jgi:DNA-binding transcriptional regulator/RsmH inhibitor MraZ
MVYLLDRRTFENYVRRCLRRTDNRDEFARNVPEQAIKTKIDDRGRVYIPTKIWRFMGWPPPKKVKLAGLGRGKIALCHWEG